MSTETPAPTPAPPTPAPPATPPAPAQDTTDWKAEARKWEARAKENVDAAKRLAELEDAQKTAEQKAAEELAKLRAENESFRQRDQVKAWADEIVKDSPVPASALRGSTREELEAHFAELKALIPSEAPKKGAIGPYVPAEGTTPRGELGSNAEKFAAAVEAHLS